MADVERRYIEILKEKKGGKSDSAFMMIDVVSFSRFAYRVLSEVGSSGGKVLSPAARTILIHRVLSESKEEFPVLGSFAERVGFVSEIDEVLGDFYRYGISGHKGNDMKTFYLYCSAAARCPQRTFVIVPRGDNGTTLTDIYNVQKPPTDIYNVLT